MQFIIKPALLTDGSTAYNVLCVNPDTVETIITFGMETKAAAQALVAALERCSWVDIDEDAAKRYGFQDD